MGDMKITGLNQAYNQDQAAEQTAADRDRKTVQEMIRESREKVQQHQQQLEKIKTKPRYGDAPLEAYARLARAKNKGQVNLAAGYARRQIAQLRSALRKDSENAEEIKAALRQLEKAVSRAGKKKTELQKEELKEARQKRLQEEQERARAQRLNQELRRSKLMRAFREQGYIHEAVTDAQQQKMLAATRAELREQAQTLQNAFAADAAYAVQQYAAQQSVTDASAGEMAVDGAVNVQA